MALFAPAVARRRCKRCNAFAGLPAQRTDCLPLDSSPETADVRHGASLSAPCLPPTLPSLLFYSLIWHVSASAIHVLYSLLHSHSLSLPLFTLSLAAVFSCGFITAALTEECRFD